MREGRVTSRHCGRFRERGLRTARPRLSTAAGSARVPPAARQVHGCFSLRSFCLWNLPRGSSRPRIQTYQDPQMSLTAELPDGVISTTAKFLCVNHFLGSLPRSREPGAASGPTGSVHPGGDLAAFRAFLLLFPLVCLFVLRAMAQELLFPFVCSSRPALQDFVCLALELPAGRLIGHASTLLGCTPQAHHAGVIASTCVLWPA